MNASRRTLFALLSSSVLATALALMPLAGTASPDGPPPTVVLKGHTADLAGADFSPDGAKVVTASSDHSARIWDTKTGAVIATLGGHTEGVRSAASARTARASSRRRGTAAPRSGTPARALS